MQRYVNLYAPAINERNEPQIASKTVSQIDLSERLRMYTVHLELVGFIFDMQSLAAFRHIVVLR